jgi:hypothetical protein
MASVLLLLMVRNSLEVDGASYTAGPVRNYHARLWETVVKFRWKPYHAAAAMIAAGQVIAALKEFGHSPGPVQKARC